MKGGKVSIADRQAQRALQLAGERGVILEHAILLPAVFAVRQRSADLGIGDAGQRAQFFQALGVSGRLLLRCVIARVG